MGEHKSYLRYLDHCRHFLAYHFFLLHQLKQKETIKRIVWNKIFHSLTVTAFRKMPLDKPNGILTMTLKSQGVHSQEMPGTEVPLGWVAIFELGYMYGSRLLPFGTRLGRNFSYQVQR